MDPENSDNRDIRTIREIRLNDLQPFEVEIILYFPIGANKTLSLHKNTRQFVVRKNVGKLFRGRKLIEMSNTLL